LAADGSQRYYGRHRPGYRSHSSAKDEAVGCNHFPIESRRAGAGAGSGAGSGAGDAEGEEKDDVLGAAGGEEEAVAVAAAGGTDRRTSFSLSDLSSLLSLILATR